jgi:hypothetical protein
MTTDEMIAAREAFKKRGFWPNEVMWGCWKDAWDAGVAAERERCALVCERKIDAPAGTYQILMAAAAAIRKGE